MAPASKKTVPCGWLRGAALHISPVTFEAKEGRYILRRMTATDYSAVREMLPLVSRCQSNFGEEDLEELLRQPSYIPLCCFCAIKGTRKGVEKEGDLCGYCELYVLPHLGRAADGRLERVVVPAHFRGKGIATAMCRLVLQLAKEQLQLGRLDLTVEKADARHIYTKLGFTPVDTETLRLQL